MNDSGTVNAQIIDSVTGVTTLITGQSPSQSFGMLDAVLLETLGMAMHNAVTRQQGAGLISSAAVTAACGKMLNAPFPIQVSPPPPAPPVPPEVNPLPTPPAPTPTQATVIAQASAEAEQGIATLKTAEQTAAANAAAAQASLQQLAGSAGGTAAASSGTNTPASGTKP
ncbi:Killing trait domain-containing protein [Solimonas aquatica]|uniref:Killing trait domain-containing protein n=1 Tax=Solimonas aquatica TaxID=489703 RepID=A0A1H9ER59_9GAMM|nr:RebB family R body protein [Solimonas aquatica]SEQ28210.1 Killing trait domain-containing protein [Solimonas aquatica]